MLAKLKLRCSGFTEPIENNGDTQDQENGARLDCNGHVTKNKGGNEGKIDSVNEMMSKHCKHYVDMTLQSCGGAYCLPASSSDDDFFS